MTGKLDDETWAKRLEDAARDGKLNVSYMDLPTFDAARVLEIKEKIPNLVELDLRSNDLAELPDELAELKNLRNVKLTYNKFETCLLYTSPSPRDATLSRMPSSA